MTKKKAVEKAAVTKAAVTKAVVTNADTETSAAPTREATFSAANIDEAAKLVDQAIAAINPGGPAMTTTQRRRTVKIRKGGEKFIPILVEIATTYAITSPVHAVGEMTTQLELVQKLVPLLRRVQVLLKLLEDTDLTANSDMWGTATFVYSVAKHMAKRDGNIALALAPVEEFFSNGPRDTTTAKKGKGGITTTTSATPGTVQAQPAATVASTVTPTTTPHT